MNKNAKMRTEAEAVKKALLESISNPGADVTIAVTNNSGETVTANLFDQLAFVEVLIESLDEFVNELAD